MSERISPALAYVLSFHWATYRGTNFAPLVAICAVVFQWRAAFSTVEMGVPLWAFALLLALSAGMGRVLAGLALGLANVRSKTWSRASARALFIESTGRPRWRGVGCAAAGIAVLLAALAVEGFVFAWRGPFLLGAFGATTVAFGVGGILGLAGNRMPRLEFSLLAVVLALWVALDASFVIRSTHLYDMSVYLGSAHRWLAGGSPYLTGPLTHLPASAAADYFLYPPPLLPVFAVLSNMPSATVAIGWVVILVAGALAAFRVMGLSWVWSLTLLLFPALVKGIESGNIVNVTFLIFVAGACRGETLVVNGLFKVQSGLPALWLVRDRAWGAIAGGIALLGFLVVLTLPLVGIDSWRAWFYSLGYRAASQTQLPILFGVSLARNLPGWAFGALALVAVAAPLLILRGRRSLAGLGLASIVASPSLWLHGFVFAIPAVLDLESGTMVWMVLGIAGYSVGAWWMVIVGALALLVARRPAPTDALHPRSNARREFLELPGELRERPH